MPNTGPSAKTSDLGRYRLVDFSTFIAVFACYDPAMLVPHAAWDLARHALLVWGETEEPRSGPEHRPDHPFVASVDQLGPGWTALVRLGQADTGS